MPQVPIYNGPQVREQALQGGFQQNIDVSSSTRALGQGLLQVAEVADRVVMRDAQDQAFKIESQIREDWQNQRAALRKQYKADNAGQYQVAADEWWKTARDTYSKDTSPMVQNLAGKSLGQLRLQAQADTLGYVESEKTKAREINFRTLQNGIITEAGQTISPDNAKALAATTSAQIYKNAIAYAAAEGLSSDVGESMAREQLDRFHADAAVALASKPGGAEAAKNYLNEFGKDIPLAVRTRVDNVVTAEVDNQFATQFAAQQAGKPLSEQIKATAEIKDPARREKALVEVKNNYALVQQAQVEREKQMSDQAWQLVGQGKKVPEALLAGMDGKERVQLQEHVRARADRLLAGKSVKTDMATYIKVREALMSDDPAVRASVNLLTLTEKIAPAQMEQLLDIKSAGSKAGSPKFDSMATDQQRIDLGLQTAKIDPKKDPESAGRFITEVDRRVRALSVSKGGKDVTPDEKQKIVDEVALNRVYLPGVFSDSAKVLSQMTPEEQNKAFVMVGGEKVRLFTERVIDGRTTMVATVPTYMRAEIEKSLRAAGRPVTEQAVAEDYQAWLATQKKKPAAPAMAPGTVLQPAGSRTGMGKPPIYAPPEEWAAYRAWQAQQRLAAGKN